MQIWSSYRHMCLVLSGCLSISQKYANVQSLLAILTCKNVYEVKQNSGNNVQSDVTKINQKTD